MTALILDPFVEGMRGAGAQVDVLYLRGMRIRPCDGDFRCWSTTPGVCRYRDDMDTALPRLRDARVWVFGVPLFLPMPGEVQNLLNRLMPIWRASLRLKGGRMYPQREPGLQLERMVLVSSCAFWELDNFEKLEHLMQEIASAADAEFAGAVLRPHAEVFARSLAAGDEAAKRVVAAASKAGRELILGTMSDDTLEAVRTPLVSFDDFVRGWDSDMPT